VRAAWIAVVLAASGFELLSRPNPDVDEGNQAYEEKRYDQALDRYEKARKSTADDAGVRYNAGTALMALGRTDEAVNELHSAAKGGAGTNAYYNLGNAHLGTGRFAEAIDAYRHALQIDPENRKAKWNLELALREKEKQEQQQQQDESDPHDQDQGDQEQSQQERDGEQGEPQEQGEQDRQGRQQSAEQEPGERQQQQPESGEEREGKPEEQAQRDLEPRAGEDAARADQAVLDAIERNEKNLQVEHLRRMYRRRHVEKDW